MAGQSHSTLFDLHPLIRGNMAVLMRVSREHQDKNGIGAQRPLEQGLKHQKS